MSSIDRCITVSNCAINSMLKRKYLNINNAVFLFHDILSRIFQFVAQIRLGLRLSALFLRFEAENVLRTFLSYML